MFQSLMQALCRASYARPSTLPGREFRRVADKLRDLISRRYDPVVNATINGFPLKVRASNSMPGRFASGFYDELPADRLLKLIGKPDAVVVDVGANIGYTALFAHAVCPNATFILIEGDPYAFDLLEQNTRTIANRTLHHVVLGEADGTIEGEFVHMTGTASFVAHGVLGANHRLEPFQPRKVENRQATLDTLLAGVDRVDLVKIDTDGYEAKVMTGARETFRRHRCPVFSEFNPSAMIFKGLEPNPIRLFELFSECGYAHFCFYDQKGHMLLSVDYRREPQIISDLISYCACAHIVMDFAAFHAEDAERFAAFVDAERLRERQEFDRYVRTYGWK